MSRKRPVTARIEGLPDRPSPVILPVCPRSQAVRGRNFTATMDTLSGHADPLHIILCDTLDRYNLPGPLPEEDSLASGSNWLAGAMPAILGRFDRVTLRRWDDVRADPTFPARLQAMQDLYRNSAAARAAVDNIAAWYLDAKRDRMARLGLAFNEAVEHGRSTAYLLEEFAGTAVYAGWYPGAPEAYWGVYVGAADIFDRLNTAKSPSLILPRTLPVRLNRLPEPRPGEGLKINHLYG